MQIEYRALTGTSELRGEVGALLEEAFGPAKAKSWGDSYAKVMAGDPGWAALTDSGELIGVAIAERVEASDCAGVCAKLAANDMPVRTDDRIGTVSFLAVQREHRGKDIGDELARRVLDDLAAQGVTFVFALSWQNGAITSDRVFQSLGFRQIEMIGDDEADPYRSDMSCEACGHGPCECEAMLYAKRLDSAMIGVGRHAGAEHLVSARSGNDGGLQ